MQSELACHIGLAGKFFCRICKVKGADIDDRVELLPVGGRRRTQESMSEMNDRILRFLKVCFLF